MHRAQPFARAIALFNAIAALMKQHGRTAESAIADLPEYVSRGKGKNSYSSTRRAAANRDKHEAMMAGAARHRAKQKAKHSRRARA